ncbi:MAG: serine--tRNA ligase [Microscillaceae bacterium]|nr:serine--tRNA ligase [Microscillaceae bacterium]
MLELQNVRENPELVIKGLRKRHLDQAEALVNQLLEADQNRRQTQVQLDRLKAELNTQSKNIGIFKAQKQENEAQAAIEATAALKAQIKEGEELLRNFEKQVQDTLYLLPNLPHDQVPEGKNAEQNLVAYAHGDLPQLPENARPHWDLIRDFDIIDFEMGVKVSGAGFPFYKGAGARLQRALISFFLDEATKAGYLEVIPPLLVNADSGYGTGQLPDKEGQMYFAPADDLYLIPTAEVPITNIFRDVILEESDFPLKRVGYTPCFRREAGSWGAEVRGLNRLHQFDKVEIVQIQHPDHSYQALEEMKTHVQGLLEKLGLPYRVLKLCAGDLGFTSAFTYDLEVFSGAQKRWLEVSSVSNFETFQANRLKLRYRAKDQKKNVLAHTLNGSALALPRIVAALLENNQSLDGQSIALPSVLHAYTGFTKIEKKVKMD